MKSMQIFQHALRPVINNLPTPLKLYGPPGVEQPEQVALHQARAGHT